MFREVTPVGHSSLRLTGQTSESGVAKRAHAGLTLLNVIDSSTEGFLEILSDVPVAQEREAYLSRMEGQIDHVVALH